jgi:hypothetical protein
VQGYELEEPRPLTTVGDVEQAIVGELPIEFHRATGEALGPAPGGEAKDGAIVMEDASQITNTRRSELGIAGDGPASSLRNRLERVREERVRLR